MAKSVDDRGRGAPLARRDEGAYCRYVTEEQRSQRGWIGREGDRLGHSRALSRVDGVHALGSSLDGRAGHDLTGGGVDGDLARRVDGGAGTYASRIGADRRRRVGRGERLLLR